MSWQTPKTNWTPSETGISDDDFNRIEGNSKFLYDCIDISANPSGELVMTENQFRLLHSTAVRIPPNKKLIVVKHAHACPYAPADPENIAIRITGHSDYFDFDRHWESTARQFSYAYPMADFIPNNTMAEFFGPIEIGFINRQAAFAITIPTDGLFVRLAVVDI